MTSSLSENGAKRYFCTVPWVGLFAIQTNQDVTFCPCFLKMKIGNLRESSIHEIWNAEPLVELRRSFREGVLPEPCRGQLCPVATQSPASNPALIDGVNGEESMPARPRFPNDALCWRIFKFGRTIILDRLRIASLIEVGAVVKALRRKLT